MGDKSERFPGSPWERFLVKYADEAEAAVPSRHSPWELYHSSHQSQQSSGLPPPIQTAMLSLLSHLHHSTRNPQDRYGIVKLNQISQKLDFINRFPVPLTLEIIELRIKNLYYRTFEAMKHDINVMLSNVRTYYTKNAEMYSKVERLYDWFQTNLSKTEDLL